jgi:hypothetical protein
MSPCLHAFMPPCFHIYTSPRLRVSVSPCLCVSMCSCVHVSISKSPSPCPCLMSMSLRFRNSANGNGTNGKWQLPFVMQRKTEPANLSLFAANGNGNRTFLFLSRQTINGKQRLLFQQTCPSMGNGQK